MINDLVLTDKQAEDNEDQALAAISELAYAAPEELTVEHEEKRFKSRFFFVLSESVHKEVERNRGKFQKKELVVIDAEIDKRVKSYRKEAPNKIAGNINAVREFFLQEIGPLTLAGSAGTIQAQQVVQRMLNTEVDGTQFSKFERMSAEAVNIRMAKFIAKYYSLPKTDVLQLLQSVAPKQQIIPIPLGMPNENRRPNESKEDLASARSVSRLNHRRRPGVD